jgi:hypothetical protein
MNDWDLWEDGNEGRMNQETCGKGIGTKRQHGNLDELGTGRGGEG